MIVHVLRKPLIGTVAANALQHGCGALNIDQCRIGSESRTGRWPANLVHDGDATTVKRFPDCMGGTWNRTDGARPFDNNGEVTNYVSSGSDRSFGSAARFFQQVALPR
jgi:site-specific DNA-methyltransferase (adenine-specific)